MESTSIPLGSTSLIGGLLVNLPSHNPDSDFVNVSEGQTHAGPCFLLGQRCRTAMGYHHLAG